MTREPPFRPLRISCPTCVISLATLDWRRLPIMPGQIGLRDGGAAKPGFPAKRRTLSPALPVLIPATGLPHRCQNRTIPSIPNYHFKKPVANCRFVDPSRAPRFAAARWQPWGAHVTADWSPSKALSHYAALQRKYPSLLAERTPMILRVINYSRGRAPRFEVRVGQSSRKKTEAFCKRLSKAGGPCLVIKTQRQ